MAADVATGSACRHTVMKGRDRSTRVRGSSGILQLCADDNMQVCYPTTPAQYFHLLRRQVEADAQQAAGGR
jgi:hypothetical protein